MATTLDFDAHVARESRVFVAALANVDPTAPVPTCPEWTAADLLWHLGEVQNFWATVLRDGLLDDAQVEQVKPERPGTGAGVLEFFNRASQALTAALAGVDDAAVAWTWSDDRTAGFIRRRQAHEALIHRVDAEVTAGHRTPMDSALSADGVDEMLRVMYGSAPAWGTFTADGRVVRLRAADGGRSWSVALGRFAGVDPTTAEPVDEPDIRVVDDDHVAVDAEITATAADLDCWLWHRPGAEVERAGDPDVLEAFVAVVAPPTD